MKLGTHEERMLALESVFNEANTAIEKAAIIETAARLSNDIFFQQNNFPNTGMLNVGATVSN